MRRRALLVSFLFFFAVVFRLVSQDVYTQTEHGFANLDGDSYVLSGSCEVCHTQHNSRDGSPAAGTGPFDYLMYETNSTAFCAGCHVDNTVGVAPHKPGIEGLWTGISAYEVSSHGQTSQKVNPDSGYSLPLCISCHDPHGAGTGTPYLALAVNDEELLCLSCHDGSPAATNISAELSKTYSHPVDAGEYNGRHLPEEGGTSSAYGTTNRHSECQDCHNPHVASADAVSPTPPEMSNTLRGVGRVAVTNGSAWQPPTYTYREPPDNTTPTTEYQVCFKCHSSWTSLPPTTPSGGAAGDKALEFNENNPSFHPVEAVGKNTDIDFRVLLGPWTAESRMYCTDCHSSNNTNIRGPHGSVYAYILKKDYYRDDGSTNPSSDLCFECHDWNQYMTKTRSTGTTYTHFRDGNATNDQNLHYEHTVGQSTSCATCHNNMHGSSNVHLLTFSSIVTGNRQYVDTGGGGYCSLRCHGKNHGMNKSYRWQ